MKNKLILLMVPFLLSACGSSQADYDAGYKKGYEEGNEAGYTEGYIDGLNTGKESGYTKGYQEGYTKGYAEGSKGSSFNPGYDLTIHTTLQDNYLKDTPANISKYASGTDESLYAPAALKLDYSSYLFPDGSNVTISVSEKKDLSNCWTFETSDVNTFDLYNCKLNTQYYWRAVAVKNTQTYISAINTFTTKDSIIRNIKAGNMSNMRDLGGYVGLNNKKIKQGMIYRSAGFNYADGKSMVLTAEGKDIILNKLVIKYDIDLGNMGQAVSELTYLNAFMQYDTQYLAGKTIIDADCNKSSIKTVFEKFADSTAYPIDFHCTRGRDRTGAIAFLLESLLGVSNDDIKRDYYFTNFAGSNTTYGNMDDYITVINKSSGNTQAEKTADFLKTVIGVSEASINAIKSILLEA